MPAPLPEDAAVQSGTFVVEDQGEAGGLSRFQALLQDFTATFRSGSKSAESGEPEEPENEDEDKTAIPLPDPSPGNTPLSVNQVAALLLASQWFAPSQPVPAVVSGPPDSDEAAEIGLKVIGPQLGMAVEPAVPQAVAAAAEGDQSPDAGEPKETPLYTAAGSSTAAVQNAAATPVMDLARTAPPALPGGQQRLEGIVTTYWRVRSDSPRAGTIPGTPALPGMAASKDTPTPGAGFEVTEIESASQGEIAFAAEICATEPAASPQPLIPGTEPAATGERTAETLLAPDAAVSTLPPPAVIAPPVPGQRSRQELPRGAATFPQVKSTIGPAPEPAGELPTSEPTPVAQRRQTATTVAPDPVLQPNEALEHPTVRPAQGTRASEQPDAEKRPLSEGAESGVPGESGKTNREKPVEPVKFGNDGSGSQSSLAENSAPEKIQPASTSNNASHPWVGTRQEPLPASAVKGHTATPAAAHPAPAEPQAGLETDAGHKSPSPAQGIRLRMNSREQESGVDVQVVQKNGRLQVAVRTDDPNLQSALRDDLGRLISRVEDQGLRAEVWTPSGGAMQQGGQNGDSSQYSGFSFNDSPSGGQSGGGESKDRQDGRQNRPAWLDQLEESFNPRSTENKEENEWARILRR